VAATSRLTPGRVAIAGTGDFGLAVARTLAKCEGVGTVTPYALESALAVGVVAVAAMWRPYPDLCERLDEVAFQAGTPWLPIVMEHPRIRVGPWGAAPAGPCYRCYCWRKRQHDTQPAVTRALEAAYSGGTVEGPRGYLPHHVNLAVGLARISLRKQAGQGTAAVAGEALLVNVFSGRSAVHTVIPSHACARCGSGDRLGGRASLSEVMSAVAGERLSAHGRLGAGWYR
jgi:bacteriocin biosynthesis cyclodehydratase domain-containing protein